MSNNYSLEKLNQQVGSGYLQRDDSIMNTSGINEGFRDESISNIKISPSGVIKAYKSPDFDSKVHLMNVNRNAAISNPNFKNMDESILNANVSTNFRIAPESNRGSPAPLLLN
jgi:WD40 repeat protein